MEFKCLNLRFQIYLAKITNFWCILHIVSSAYSTKQYRDLVKHGTHWIVILLNYEFQSRKPNILFMSYRDRILKIVFKRQIKAHLKKTNWRRSLLRLLGRESVHNVARRGYEVAGTPPLREPSLLLTSP